MEIKKYFDIHKAQNGAFHSGNSFEIIRAPTVMNTKRVRNEYICSTKNTNEVYNIIHVHIFNHRDILLVNCRITKAETYT